MTLPAWSQFAPGSIFNDSLLAMIGSPVEFICGDSIYNRQVIIQPTVTVNRRNKTELITYEAYLPIDETLPVSKDCRIRTPETTYQITSVLRLRQGWWHLPLNEVRTFD